MNLLKYFNIFRFFREILRISLHFLFDFRTEDDIDEKLFDVFISFAKWFIACFVDGLLLNYAISLIFGLKISVFTIFAYGVGVWYIIKFKERLLK